jgi:hypothetical protein
VPAFLIINLIHRTRKKRLDLYEWNWKGDSSTYRGDSRNSRGVWIRQRLRSVDLCQTHIVITKAYVGWRRRRGGCRERGGSSHTSELYSLMKWGCIEQQQKVLPKHTNKFHIRWSPEKKFFQYKQHIASGLCFESPLSSFALARSP